MSATPEQLLDVAVDAARAAGAHALANPHRRRETLRTLKHDVKLALDVECQQQAIAAIRARYPDADILGEEAPDHHGPFTEEAGIRWIVDPIDGTINFSHGLPLWCASVAAWSRGEPVAGAVYAAELDELYTAHVGTESRLNGEPIRVSGTASLSDALAFMGFYQANDYDVPAAPVMAYIGSRVQKVRTLGSAALDMCRVARGHAELYWEPGIYVWDMAASGLIVRQAGGVAEVLQRRDGHRLSCLAANAALADDFRELVLKALALATPA